MSASDDTSLRPTLFIRFLNRRFRAFGYLAADYPISVIVVVTLITAGFSIKIPFTRTEDDIKTGYTPHKARAFEEIQIYRKFNDGKDPLLMFVIVIAKDGGSMTRMAHLNATVDMIDNIGTGFSVKNLTYTEICDNFCLANEPVRLVRNGLLLNEGRVKNDSEPYFTYVSFPITRFFGRDLDLTSSFFGVKTFDSDNENSENGTNIKEVKVIVLQFRSPRPLQWNLEDTANWERMVGNYYRNEYNSSLVKPLVFSLAYTEDEIVRTGLSFFPYLSFGFIGMSVFSVATVFIGSKYMGLWSIHKVTFAISACICPLMATSTALGLLFCFGFRFGSILGVTPFLVLAIGVDDAYLMINAWNLICKRRRKCPVGDTLRDRMAEVLVDVGPSITITSLTNMLAFGIGALTPTPEIQLLCIANTTALFLDWLYTITIYAAIMSLGAKYEILAEDVRPVADGEDKKTNAERFLENYCEWLSSGFTSFVMLIFLGLYWWTSIKGALSAKAVLTPDKLFLSNSPMLEMNALRSKYVMPAYTFITVYVTKPGNLSEAMSVARIKNMVGEFEALPECNGPMFTKFWIRDYESYRSSELVADDPSFAAAAYSSEDIRTFLKFSEYSHWGGFMKFDNDTDTISAFFMTVAYHGANQSDWNQRLIMLKKWRAIVDRFKDIGASIYEDEALFTDQIETLVPTTVQTSLMTLACMTLVCCAFMSNIFTVLIAASSITSICVGVFGFLSLWGIDVDPISMATLIMSIGLSVDFPAHITFHYYRTGLTSNLTTVQERMAHSLSAIGFPLLQSSLSTVLFVLSLLFTPCYMTEVFIKAVFLVISLGIVHALVAIPALLCALSHIYKYLSDIRDNSSVMSGSAASRETKVSKLSQSPVVRRIRSETGNKIVPVAGNLRR